MADQMAGLDFLDFYPPGDASITVVLPDGNISSLPNLSTHIIGHRCPILFLACEDGPLGRPKATVEASSLAVVVSFLRHLYTGDYLTTEEECGSISLLSHVEIYRLAQNFDVPELQVAAYLNILRETERSCSLPYPPEGLCPAIKVIYTHLASEKSLVDTLLNYCVSSFAYHGLGTNETFRQVAFVHPEFVRDLCRTSADRKYHDDGACDIVQLPVCRSTPVSSASVFGSVEKRTHGEFQFDEWYDSEPQGCMSNDGTSSSDEAQMEHFAKRRRLITEEGFTVVYRPKHGGGVPTSSDSDHGSENEDGFTVVMRPVKEVDSRANVELPTKDTEEISKPLSNSASETTLVNNSTADSDKAGYLAEFEAIIKKEESDTDPFGGEETVGSEYEYVAVKSESKDDPKDDPKLDARSSYTYNVPSGPSSPTLSDWTGF